jgi:hypothetical protein
MDFFTDLLARLFETFRIKNPIVAGVVLLILGTFVHFANQGTALGLFALPEWAAGAVQFISTALLALTGGGTAQSIRRPSI